MNASQKSMRHVASSRGSSVPQSICRSCRESIFRRQYATAAAAVADPPTANLNNEEATQALSPKLAYRIKAGILLSRPPQITRDLTPFEKAFFLYQKRLNERLALPFTRYFYYKKGTPADLEWKKKIKDRVTPARDIGNYNAYSKEGWNDEVLVGAKEAEPEHQIEALLKDAEPVQGDQAAGAIAKKEAIDRPVPRTTEADTAKDQKSLNRLLQRSLYLLVRDSQGNWGLPAGIVQGRESLRQAADRVLAQSAGVKMNTWIVGNAPVGHNIINYHESQQGEEGTTYPGEKTFFIKGRIMAGQANLADNAYGLKEFKWLAKEEIQQVVTRGYWSSIKNMLVDR